MSAYDEGKKAGYNEESYSNPYPDDTPESEEWYRGYNDGQAKLFGELRRRN